MPFVSPLRYPGGKSKLSPFIKYIIYSNEINGGTYIEPYAGGAGIACDLILSGIVQRAIINDADKAVWAFWNSILTEPERFCRIIDKISISIAEWKRQKEIFKSELTDTFALGFATFYLNRTNVSGVIKGGVIGGQTQQGKYKISARFTKKTLIQRIESIASHAESFSLYNYDAIDFMNTILPSVGKNVLVYLDPPYYEKGQALYRNYYNDNDHKIIAQYIKRLKVPWICSYDNVPSILQMYKRIQRYEYGIPYSAKKHYTGGEVIFFSNMIKIPEIQTPLEITTKNWKMQLKTLKFRPLLVG